MTASPEAYSAALRYYRSGDLAQTEQACRELLQADAFHGGALHLLGILAYQQGRADEAVGFLRRAVAAQPNDPATLSNLGLACQAVGKADDAIAHYRQAIRIKPDHAEAYYNLGITLAAQGKQEEAGAAYREAIRVNPAYAEAHSNLGNVLWAQRKLDEAAVCFREALRLRPDLDQARSNLGAVFTQQQRLDEAVACFREILARHPDHTDALNNLGVALREQGQLEEAANCFRRALRVKPDYAQAHHNLGQALAGQGRTEEALACYRQAVRLKPDYSDAQQNLGLSLLDLGRTDEALAYLREAVRLDPEAAEALNNLGVALYKLGRYDEAADSCRRALGKKPDWPEAHNNLAVALGPKAKPEEVRSSLQEALRLRPDYAEAHSNLGNFLRDQGDIDVAFEHFRRAIELKPDYPEAYNNYGIALKERGRLDEALASYERAIRLKPSYADVHANRAQAWLLAGDFQRGWAEYEWRWRVKPLFTPRTFKQSLWDGSPLAGRTILLHAEQGLGDTLQFVRYAPLVKERGGKVILECQKALIPILKSCGGIDELVPQGAKLPEFNIQAPLLSLPRIFGTTLETIPAQVPYVTPDGGLVEQWRRELGQTPEFKIGIAWQGNPNYADDRRRSVPLRCFEPLARLPGVRLYSLQKGAGVEQIREVGFPVTDLGSRLDLTAGAFMDTAAVLKTLDLLVTSDSAIVHLAGALAAPIWMALPLSPDWRWLLEREDSPWYPTMRLFRQVRLGDWADVFERITAEVARRMASAPARPIPVEIAAGELIDKITILEIKAERITDAAKLGNVRMELDVLTAARDRWVRPSDALAGLTTELKAVNEKLWDIEDEIRACERARDFGPRFVELARSVYHNNDHRAAVKRQINALLGSRLVEEKSYAEYQ